MVHPVLRRVLLVAVLLSMAAVVVLPAVNAAEDCDGSPCTSASADHEAPSRPAEDPCLWDVACGGGASLHVHLSHGSCGVLAGAPATVTLGPEVSHPSAVTSWCGATLVDAVDRPPRWVS
jgi:hypothetical protein